MRTSRLVPLVVMMALTPFVASADLRPVFWRALAYDSNRINTGDFSGGPHTQSNISWAPTDSNVILADDFIFSYALDIDTLSVWMVAARTSSDDPWDELLSLSLFTGESNVGVLTSRSVFTPSSPASVATWALERMTLIDQANTYKMFKITFNNLQWSVAANTYYDFGIEGLGTGPKLYLSATNSSRGGAVFAHDGYDDSFVDYISSDRGVTYNLRYGYDPAYQTDYMGFPGGSDLNVAITRTPEPGTFGLFVAAGALAFFLRRKK